MKVRGLSVDTELKRIRVMAGDLMLVTDGLEFWLDLLALIVAFRAAAIEAANVRRGVDGATGFGYAQPARGL